MHLPLSVDVDPFWARLSAYGDSPALIGPTETLSYATLAERVAAFAAVLGTTRRLVVIEGGNTVEAVVAYLAALHGGHPAILVPSAEAVASYDADVVVSGSSVVERREGTAHDLHPELALMLSTSGSTGSPKLVRLSHRNLTANASAIASYLQIRPTDVAPTTLPMHYCYGLSVINSHLSVGAAVLLTDESLTSAGFWESFRTTRCTTLAGVPYTFELLDRVGFASMHLPSLRYVTQAGGRLEPGSVRRYAELGQQRGFDLFVMYGQTEATARMAYLPPDLTLSCAGAIGVPIPGGTFSLTGEGELVYTGENVMLGYAEGPEDLALGRVVHELHTGDLARLRPDGLYEVTGRISRFAKVFGLRIDLDRLERVLAAAGTLAHCADGGDRVVVAVDVSARPAPPRLAEEAAAVTSLPVSAVQVLPLSEVPRLPSGKTDYAAVVRSSEAAREASRQKPAVHARSADLVDLFGEVLRRHDVTPDDSFVSLRGDSLSYVEMAARLEQALGLLPPDWHRTPIRDLAATSSRRRWGRSVETNVVLRALAIVLIVGAHTDLWMLMGGAHLLLAVAGYNFGRFFLTESPRAERVRHITRGTARIVVPSVLWLAVAALLTPEVTWKNVVLLNGVLGTSGWSDPWRYWFIEALVYTFVWLAALLAVPAVDRLERRWSFWLPLGLACIALLTRYDVVGLRDGVEHYRAHVIFWLFALGWAGVKAAGLRHRVVVTAVTLATVPGFFEQGDRTALVIVGLLLLVWVRAVRVPTLLAGPIGVLASASLYVYLSHWQVYPRIEAAGHQVLATLASLAVGIALWWAVGRLTRPGANAMAEIGDNLRWLTPRRCATRELWNQRPAARTRGHDQPAHLTP